MYWEKDSLLSEWKYLERPQLHKYVFTTNCVYVPSGDTETLRETSLPKVICRQSCALDSMGETAILFHVSNNRWILNGLAGLRTLPYKENAQSRISLLCARKKTFTNISNSFLCIGVNVLEKRLSLF